MNPLEQLTYGTFILTIKHQDKRNACILNTVIQFSKDYLLMTIQNDSYSHELLKTQTNVVIHTIHENASLQVFQQFGYQSGRSIDKLEGIDFLEDEEHIYLLENINSYFKGLIEQRIYHTTHTIYLVKILEMASINDIPSLTYQNYKTIVKNKQKTMHNLQQAFLMESGARNKYTFYASIAKKNGYPLIQQFFETIADNEKEHAKLWLKQLDELDEDTLMNLKNAQSGENQEWTTIYRQFEKEAREEGYTTLADLFYMAQKIEQDHARQMELLISKLEDNSLFLEKKDIVWTCKNCGYFYTGKEALENCPFCDHPIGYMERKKI